MHFRGGANGHESKKKRAQCFRMSIYICAISDLLSAIIDPLVPISDLIAAISGLSSAISDLLSAISADAISMLW